MDRTSLLFKRTTDKITTYFLVQYVENLPLLFIIDSISAIYQHKLNKILEI